MFTVRNVYQEVVWQGADSEKAERVALVVAVNSGRTSYLEES